MYSPSKYDYCQVFRKYKKQYDNQRIIAYFEDNDICAKVNSEGVKMLPASDTDFFTFLQSNFFGKRLFIDLWATWCAPCKKEFVSYDSSFYNFAEENQLSLAYISIDDPENREKWEKEVKVLGLKGYHALAGQRLLSSIKEIFYDSSQVSIPRYILVDEQGKILSTNFTRPSDESFQASLHDAFRSR